MLIDTHIHLDWLADPPAQVAAARAAGVGSWVVPGVAPAGWEQLLAMVAATPGAWAAPGIHPLEAAAWDEEAGVRLEALLAGPHCAALGEVGLDRQSQVPLADQETVLRRQIAIARNHGKPLLLHCRGATGRLLESLRDERAGALGGIAHAFSGSLEVARQLIDLGFALGIGGVATFPEAHRLHAVIRQVPGEWLVLESDAPDLAPHPHRGALNRPEWLPLVAARVAELRGWSSEETARITTLNARRVLRLVDTVERSISP